MLLDPHPQPLALPIQPLPPGNEHVTLYQHVPQPLWHKIWNNEFVDFTKLLKDTRYHVEGPKVLEECNGQLVVDTKPVACRVSNYIVWRSAFDVFVALYLIRYPQTCIKLCQYAYTIQDYATNTPWPFVYNYDVMFRQKASEQDLTSWD